MKKFSICIEGTREALGEVHEIDREELGKVFGGRVVSVSPDEPEELPSVMVRRRIEVEKDEVCRPR